MMIDNVYEQLQKDNLCKNAYDFSVRFMGKSKSYYSVLKTRKEAPSIEAISTLELALRNASALFSSNRYPFYERNREMLLRLSADVGRYREERCNELLDRRLYP